MTERSPTKKGQIKEYLENEDAFGTALLAIIIDNYTTEAFSWEPATLNMQLSDDFGARPPQSNRDKIWALITALTTNQFYVSMEVFAHTCTALSGEEVDLSIMEPMDPEAIAWGVSEVLMNDEASPEYGNEDFSSEIEAFTGVTLYQHGIFEPPKILSFAQMPVENPTLALETAFTDDTMMFEASMLNQRSRVDQINSYVQKKYTQLVNDLKSLPLSSRDPQFGMTQPR